MHNGRQLFSEGILLQIPIGTMKVILRLTVKVRCDNIQGVELRNFWHRWRKQAHVPLPPPMVKLLSATVKILGWRHSALRRECGNIQCGLLVHRVVIDESLFLLQSRVDPAQNHYCRRQFHHWHWCSSGRAQVPKSFCVGDGGGRAWESGEKGGIHTKKDINGRNLRKLECAKLFLDLNN